MIDQREYYRFQTIEMLFAQQKLDLILFEAKKVKLENQKPLLVKDSFHGIQKYDHYVHPKFGVVQALDDVDGGAIGKSPLCEQLDMQLFGYTVSVQCNAVDVTG